MENRTMWIIIGAAVVLILIIGSLSSLNYNGGYGMMNGYYGGWNIVMWILGFVFMAIVIIALVLLILWLFRQLSPEARRATRNLDDVLPRMPSSSRSINSTRVSRGSTRNATIIGRSSRLPRSARAKRRNTGIKKQSKRVKRR